MRSMEALPGSAEEAMSEAEGLGMGMGPFSQIHPPIHRWMDVSPPVVLASFAHHRDATLPTHRNAPP